MRWDLLVYNILETLFFPSKLGEEIMKPKTWTTKQWLFEMLAFKLFKAAVIEIIVVRIVASGNKFTFTTTQQ